MKNKKYIKFLLIFLISTTIYANDRTILLEKNDIDEQKTEKRVALVIGNGNYSSSPLKNSVNDARVMAEILKKLGFDVIKAEDVEQKEMKKAIDTFGEKIRNTGVGLFYYAGHGMQVKGRNYLIPVNTNIEREEDVEYEAIDVGRVLAKMESAKNRLNIVILDACRNNPFARSFRSDTRGLATLDAPGGTFIAYATAPGEVASDGKGKNGIYTQELIKNMQIAGLKIEEMFKKVRVGVKNQTDDKQVPWEASSLEGDFYFNFSENIGEQKQKKAEDYFEPKIKKEESIQSRIKGNLIINGGFTDRYDGWKREISGDITKGLSKTEIIAFSNVKSEKALHIKHEGESFIQFSQIINVPRSDMIFSASFQASSHEGMMIGFSGTGIVQIGLIYIDESDTIIGQTLLFNHVKNPFADTPLLGVPRRKSDTYKVHYIEIRNKNFYQDYQIEIRKEIEDNLLGVNTDNVKKIAVVIGCGATHRQAGSELWISDINLEMNRR